MKQEIKTLLRGNTKGYINAKNGLFIFFGNGEYFKLKNKYVTDKETLKTAEILAD